MQVKRSALMLAVAAILGPCIADAAAQTYPTRPVRLIIPFAPGGGVDFMGRVMAQKLTDVLGQPVVVDNRSSGGGVIGAELAARANPDGHTLIMGNNSTHGVSQSVNPGLPYDSIKDFSPVSLIASAPHLLLTSSSVPAKTVREFVKLAKSRPGKLNYGSSGSGSQTQLSMELFKFVTRRL